MILIAQVYKTAINRSSPTEKPKTGMRDKRRQPRKSLNGKYKK